jgi:tetratricopeptide (TPR) repeat protein
VPQDLIRILVAGAEGNPFYIEELVKMLIDQKVILPDKNEWFIELKRLKSIQVPSTLIGVLQARLDTLPADELETMQRASVVGRVFWDGALDALVDSGIESQHVRLGLLGKRELIYERGESIFAGTKEFVFKHALLREVTYESVLKRTKRTYHARTAAWFINMARERVNEYAGVIAEHFEQAQEYFVAAEWYSKAGEIAIGRSAFKTAADYFANALELTPPDMTNHTVLARQKGDAYFRMGDLPRAQQALMEAHDTSVSIQDHADALALLAEVSSEMGDYDRANTLLSEALPQARECANHLTLTRALFALGSVQWRMGNLFESKAAFTECLVLARELGDGLRELFALNRLGAVSLSQGDLEGAERMWLEVHARATEIGNRERAMAALNNLGSVASLRNEYIQANNYILGALDIARELGTQQTVALALINLGEVNINLGNLTQARQMLREGLGLALQLGMLPRILGAIIFFAELAHAEGDDNRCWTLWGLAKNHPAWTNELQRAMNSAIERWQVRDAEIEKILMLGAKLDWDQTIKELLSDN